MIMLYHSSCRLQLKLPPLAVSTVKKERSVLFRARRPGSLPVGLLTYSLLVADGHCESLATTPKSKKSSRTILNPGGPNGAGRGWTRLGLAIYPQTFFFFFFFFF